MQAVTGPSVDVIVPYADSETNLRQLNLWINASAIPSNFRILLIHDVWREDKTSASLLSTLSRLPQGSYIYTKGKFGSPGAARNAGLDLSDSDWVCFWDSDDLPDPQEFNRMILNAHQSEAELCIGKYEMRSSLPPHNQLSTCSSGRTQVAISPGFWRMAFLRKVVSRTRFSSVRMGEDQLFLMMINYASLKTYRHAEVVYRYYTGSEMQLTAGRENYRGLTETLPEAIRVYAKKNSFLVTLNYGIMVNRIAFTMLKYNTGESFRSKITGVLKLNLKSTRILFFGAIPSLLVIAGYKCVDLLLRVINTLRRAQ